MQVTKRQVLFWAALFLFLVAFVLHSRQLFHMAFAAATLWPVSRLLARSKLKGLDVVRSAPKSLHAGQTDQVRLRVINPGQTRRLFVEVTDQLPAQAAGDDPRFVMPLLEAASEAEFSYSLQTSLRGVYQLGPLRLETADTLGLSKFTRQIAKFAEVIVYPTPLNLPTLWPMDGGSHQPRHPMRRPGEDGLQFHGIRSYVHGDDPRRIHWKTTARTGELMTIQMAREQSLEGMMILDLDGAHHSGDGLFSTLEQGVLLAATAARQARSLNADVGLIAVGAEDYTVPLERGIDRYHALLEALARVQTTAVDNWPDAVVERLGSVPRRGAALVISPRTDAGALRMAAQLVGRGHRISWLALLPSDNYATEFASQLQSVGCQVRTVNCSRPLPLQFGTGTRTHATVYHS